jgi:hypothetical protein
MTADLPARIRRFEREMKWRINPIQVISQDDGRYSNPLGNMEMVKEPKYSWFMRDSAEYFALTLRERPIRKVQRLRVFIGNTLWFVAPQEWIVVDERAGRLNLVPVQGALIVAGADIGFSLMQSSFRYQNRLPQSLSVDYQAGLPDNWRNTREWADVQIALTEYCALEILNDISDLFDAGMMNVSVSGDGLSQQLNYDRFQRRKQELAASIAMFKGTLTDDVEPILMAGL